jgi:glutamyl-tRNA synthetase
MRVRFAPSPTGYLHVGGARTALFNWLLARHNGGVFVLRIEDTDRERSSAAMTDAILDSMAWLGLHWDEGPYHQADGLERHRDDVTRLLHDGAAYRCFCTPAEIEVRRKAAAETESYRYDRHCLTRVSPEEAQRRAATEPFTVRFRVPEGLTAWEDAIHGRIAFDNAEIEDFIILRTDGTPIYNLAVVSDDVHMRITHVVRGDDHISNTPKQILLYQALGKPVPAFGHVPLILGTDGKRLSKRHGATAVGEYRRLGILPQAMVNFLALLGWSPGNDEEIFTVAELVDRFTLDGVNAKSAVFDVQKLYWLNGQHLNRMSAESLEAVVLEALARAGLETAGAAADGAWLHALIELLKPRARTIDDLVSQARPYIDARVAYDPEATGKYWKDSEVGGRLRALASAFAAVAEWNPTSLEEALRRLAAESGIGGGKLIHPLRVALTGQAVSPGIFDVAALMGRERVLARLEEAVTELDRRHASNA